MSEILVATKPALLTAAFGNVSWDSNLDNIIETMEEIDFRLRDTNSSTWRFRGSIKSPELYNVSCNVYFGHYGLPYILDCTVFIDYDDISKYGEFFDFYLEALNDKYGDAKYIHSQKEEALWYHVDDLVIGNPSDKLKLYTDINKHGTNILIHYAHPEYKEKMDAIKNRKKANLRNII